MEILKVSITVFIVTLSFIAMTSVDAVDHHQADTPAVASAGGSTTDPATLASIQAPQDGDRFTADQSIPVDYRVRSGPRGDHVHLYVDGKEVATLREPEGSQEIGPLEAGRHTVTIKVVNRAHVPIGVQFSVTIQVD